MHCAFGFQIVLVFDNCFNALRQDIAVLKTNVVGIEDPEVGTLHSSVKAMFLHSQKILAQKYRMLKTRSARHL